MLSAREVRIGAQPSAPPAGCESVHVTAAEGSGAREVLQATFEAGHIPAELDLGLLRVGAALACVGVHLGE
jgi:hypothetical protein